jgi:hypothetical protein
MADEPTTPPTVKTEKDWLRIAQFVAVALIPMLQSLQLSGVAKTGDPNIPPAPPAPAITAATLHDDNVELKKLLGELGDKLDALKPKK